MLVIYVYIKVFTYSNCKIKCILLFITVILKICIYRNKLNL